MEEEKRENEKILLDVFSDLEISEKAAKEIIEKVNTIAFLRALDTYADKFTPEMKEQFKNISSLTQLANFLKDNASNLPQISKEEIEKIVEETWTEYFDNFFAELEKTAEEAKEETKEKE
jgi:hypothetical protein